jgi:hypothetical protein
VTYIKTIRDLEQLAAKTTPTFTPTAEAVLDILLRIRPQLQKKGWQVTIANNGTRSVCWYFLKPGTKRTICRVATIIPIAHYPIKPIK